jgi:ketosteroid isomerase-like protein
VSAEPGAEENRGLIERLYGALDRADGAAMTACYAPDARFSDPAFGELRGEEIGRMWRMLASRSTDLDVELAEREGDDEQGSARWIATYTFRTGRPVRNEIRASFRFRDGKIVEHVDRFPFHRWARQALGPPGWLLGLWPLRLLIRRRARADLSRFRAERSERPAAG